MSYEDDDYEDEDENEDYEDEDTRRWYVESSTVGGFVAPFGSFAVHTPHDPNNCEECAQVVVLRQRVEAEVEAERRRSAEAERIRLREQPPESLCRFYFPATADDLPEGWPFAELLGYPACTCPAMAPQGVGQCRYPSDPTACPARKAPEEVTEREPFVHQLVSP